MTDYWKRWLKAAAVRALKTCAQSACAAIGSSTMAGAVNWGMVASTALLAAVLSLLTSVAGLPEVQQDTSGAADQK